MTERTEPGYEINDPRPIGAEAPYTYYLPSENELLAVLPGDLVKLVIRSIPQSEKYDAERMWVAVTSADADALEGDLQNTPCDMPHLTAGSKIAFRRTDIIDIMWSDTRAITPPPKPPRREYWDRCYVDSCIFDEGVLVEYLYREDPDPTSEGEEFPDSGWRIRADYRLAPPEEIDARSIDYLALGKVLNQDDSWLHLIDAPIGSAFLRNWETGAFEPAD